jgi:hypothetical protein
VYEYINASLSLFYKESEAKNIYYVVISPDSSVSRVNGYSLGDWG